MYHLELDALEDNKLMKICEKIAAVLTDPFLLNITKKNTVFPLYIHSNKFYDIHVYAVIYKRYDTDISYLALYTSYPLNVITSSGNNKHHIHGGITHGICYDKMNNVCGEYHEHFPEMKSTIGCDYARLGDEKGDSYTPFNIYSSIMGLMEVSCTAYDVHTADW